MQTLSAAHEAQANAIAKRPIWVAEVVWENDAHTSGVNDIYYASAEYSSIVNGPGVDKWFPYLDATKLSSVSQTIDPISGVSTIGGGSFELVDVNKQVSEAIRLADDAGYGLNRQRVDIYLTYEGEDWANAQIVRRSQIASAEYINGVWRISYSDLQRTLKKNVFEPVKDILVLDMLVGDTQLTLQDSASFLTAVQPDGTYGYIKIQDEIIKWTSNGTIGANILGGLVRGQLGSLAVAHTAGDDVQEIIYFHENAISIAKKVMFGGNDITRSNYIADSDDASKWGLASITVTINNSLDPLGNQVMDKLAATSSTPGQTHWAVAAAAAVSNISMVSVIAKSNGLSSFRLASVLNSQSYADFNLSTGLVTTAANGVAAISAIQPNGSYMCSFAPTALGTGAIIQLLENTTGSPAFAGDGVSGIDVVALQADIQDYQGRITTTGPVRLGVTIRNDLPPHWYLGMTEQYHFDTASWVSEGAVIAGYDPANPLAGFLMEFVIAKSTDGKRFLESEIMRVLGAFMPIKGNGKIGLRSYNDLAQSESVIPIDAVAGPQSPIIDDTVAVKWGNLKVLSNGDLTTIVRMDYDESPKTSGKFIRTVLFVDEPATTKHGNGKEIRFKSKGLIPNGVFVSQIYQRFQRVLSRFSRPPMHLNVTLLPKMLALEVGDIVRTKLPIFDPFTGADINRVFEVLKTTVKPATGEVSVDMVAQPEQAIITGFQAPLFADVVYQVGTQLTAADSRITGDAVAGYTIVDGSAFTSGDYWFDGDVTLLLNTSATISGTVRLFSIGTVTISGTITGTGGGQVALGGSSLGFTTPAGHVGRGGHGTVASGENEVWQLASGFHRAQHSDRSLPSSDVEFQAPPLVQIIGTSVDVNGKVDAVSGIPTNLVGGAGGRGSSYRNLVDAGTGGPWGDWLPPAPMGGNGGAGLLIMARGIFVTQGQIYLDGVAGDVGTGQVHSVAVQGLYSEVRGNGGAGGGGSFIALAERDANGLPNLNILLNNIHTTGGDTAAGNGQKISQVIG